MNTEITDEETTHHFFEVQRKETDDIWSVFVGEEFSDDECDYREYIDTVRKEMPENTFQLVKYHVTSEVLD